MSSFEVAIEVVKIVHYQPRQTDCKCYFDNINKLGSVVKRGIIRTHKF